MKRLAMAGLVALAAMPGTALANWQRTKWGMTVPEVRAAAPRPIRVPASSEVLDDNDAVALLAAPYQAGPYRFEAVFLFGRSSRLLSEVKLDVIERAQCEGLLGSLRTEYGKEERVISDVPVDLHIWRSATTGDLVQYLAVGLDEPAMCAVTYKPPVAPGASGL